MRRAGLSASAELLVTHRQMAARARFAVVGDPRQQNVSAECAEIA